MQPRPDYIVFFFFIILLLIAGERPAAPLYATAQNTDELIVALDERIPGLMTRYEIPGIAVAVVSEGEVALSNAYGFADLDDERSMTTGTVNRMESISKSVTAWGVMKLVEDGKIDPDKPVHQYLENWEFPESDYDTDSITIKHLLSHTSGIPLGTIGAEFVPEEEKPSLQEHLTREVKLIQEPGSSFIYSNPGFNLFELLIEEVTGLEFAEFMQDEVLNPLGMTDSSFEWSEDFRTPVPNGHNLRGEAIPVYVYPDKAAGGLFATTEDIARFVAAGMYNGNPVLSGNTLRKVYDPAVETTGIYSLVSDYYGFGHFIETLPDGEKAVFHGGQGNGWMTHFHLVPETGDGIVILTNSSRSWPLIARVLDEWAQWSGFKSTGMSLILTANTLLWIITALIFFGAIAHAFRVFRGMRSRKRSTVPHFKNIYGMQGIQLALCIILLSMYLWSITQDFLIITSVFPSVSSWLMDSLLIAALSLFFSGMFPKTKVQLDE